MPALYPHKKLTAAQHHDRATGYREAAKDLPKSSYAHELLMAEADKHIEAAKQITANSKPKLQVLTEPAKDDHICVSNYDFGVLIREYLPDDLKLKVVIDHQRGKEERWWGLTKEQVGSKLNELHELQDKANGTVYGMDKDEIRNKMIRLMVLEQDEEEREQAAKAKAQARTRRSAQQMFDKPSKEFSQQQMDEIRKTLAHEMIGPLSKIYNALLTTPPKDGGQTAAAHKAFVKELAFEFEKFKVMAKDGTTAY